MPRARLKRFQVPWADPGARFTALFESLVIDWVREASVAPVARGLRLSCHQIDRIMMWAADRGLRRRKELEPRALGIDETSYQKRHEYITVVSDLDDGAVRYVGDGRREESLEPLFEGLDNPQGVCMSIATASIASSLLPDDGTE